MRTGSWSAAGPAATVARELQGAFEVTVLEAGRPFRRLGLDLATIERLRNSRVLFDPRLIRAAFPAMQVRRTGDMYLVNGIGVGGTTPMATGNGIRADGAIRALGIDLDSEFEQIGREIHLSTAHQARWHPDHSGPVHGLRRAEPRPAAHPQDDHRPGGLPALRPPGLGCPYGVKWDSRRYLDEAVARGAPGSPAAGSSA